jgi:hypothetical protein
VLWLVPRSLAGVGIRIGPDGLSLVRKKPWRLRGTISTALPWDRIQVIVARRGFSAGDTNGKHRRTVDLYLRDDPPQPHAFPGVGIGFTVSRHEQPDSTGTSALAVFPSTRLRLTYRPDHERRGRTAWDRLGEDKAGVHVLPPHQLRPALLAFRPDLCHGFDDE